MLAIAVYISHSFVTVCCVGCMLGDGNILDNCSVPMQWIWWLHFGGLPLVLYVCQNALNFAPAFWPTFIQPEHPLLAQVMKQSKLCLFLLILEMWIKWQTSIFLVVTQTVWDRQPRHHWMRMLMYFVSMKCTFLFEIKNTSFWFLVCLFLSIF